MLGNKEKGFSSSGACLGHKKRKPYFKGGWTFQVGSVGRTFKNSFFPLSGGKNDSPKKHKYLFSQEFGQKQLILHDFSKLKKKNLPIWKNWVSHTFRGVIVSFYSLFFFFLNLNYNTTFLRELSLLENLRFTCCAQQQRKRNRVQKEAFVLIVANCKLTVSGAGVQHIERGGQVFQFPKWSLIYTCVRCGQMPHFPQMTKKCSFPPNDQQKWGPGPPAPFAHAIAHSLSFIFSYPCEIKRGFYF